MPAEAWRRLCDRIASRANRICRTGRSARRGQGQHEPRQPVSARRSSSSL